MRRPFAPAAWGYQQYAQYRPGGATPTPKPIWPCGKESASVVDYAADRGAPKAAQRKTIAEALERVVSRAQDI